MTTDGLFTLKRFEIHNWSYGRPLHLFPFGDVHHDSPAHAAEKWAEFRAYTKKCKDKVFLGMGDYLDSFSTSERAILYNAGLHDSTIERNEAEAKGRVAAFLKDIEYMRGNIIGFLGGNHYVMFENGTTGDQLMAERMKCSYLGSCSFIRLSFVFKHGEYSRAVCADIFAHHGRGGGTTVSGSLMAVERLSKIAQADITLMGHNHKRGAIPLDDRLCLDGCKELYLRSRKSFIGRTGAFLKAYDPGHRSYAVDAAMSPSNLGWIEFLITPIRTRENGQDRLTVDIQAVQ